MNWTMVSVIVAVLIALTGGFAKLISSLVKTYFATLSGRLDGFENRLTKHIEAEDMFQKNLTAVLASVNSTLIRLETTSLSYVSVASHLEALRKIDADITNARHSVRNEIQISISKLETDHGYEVREIKRRIEHLESQE